MQQIAELLDRASEGRRQLILIALQPAFGSRPPEQLVTLCDILLDFPSWQRLTRGSGPATHAAEMVLAEALNALVSKYRPGAGLVAVDKHAKSRSGRKPI